MDLISSNTEQGITSSITNLRDKPISYGSSIVNRDAGVRFYSTGSSTYNSRSNRQLTIKLSSTSYIDAATACLCFQLKPGSTVGQIPESDFALACFQTATLRSGGRIIEDIQNASDILRPLFYMSNSGEVVKTTPGHYKFNRVPSAFVNVSSVGVVTGANLLTSANNGDTIFLFYSGHGTYLRDTNNNEKTKNDQLIVPLDLNIIVDDELKSIINNHLKNQ